MIAKGILASIAATITGVALLAQGADCAAPRRRGVRAIRGRGASVTPMPDRRVTPSETDDRHLHTVNL